VWLSHRHTCSMQTVGRSPRENRSCRKPANIPPAGREAPLFTAGRMSRMLTKIGLSLLWPCSHCCLQIIVGIPSILDTTVAFPCTVPVTCTDILWDFISTPAGTHFELVSESQR